jgi:hypothetical protein
MPNPKTLALLAALLLQAAPQEKRWGVAAVDEDSVTLLAGALNLEGQPGWRYYNSGDSPEGGYYGTLPPGSSTLRGTLKLPKPLGPGRYYLFFKGIDYQRKKTLRAFLGGGVSEAVVLDDRDANGAWTDRAVVDVAAPSDALQVTITRSGDPAEGQRYLFRGLYVTSDARATVHRSDVVVKLARPEAMDNTPPTKGNMVGNGGFETGVDAGWGFDGGALAPIWDATQGVEGQGSLKFPASEAPVSLFSRVYHLKPNRKYSASAWVKSPAGRSAKVVLELRNPFVPPRGYGAQVRVQSAPASVGEAWTRVTVGGALVEFPTSDYQIVVTASDAIWLDGVQLEEGDVTDFRPAADVEAGVILDPPGHLFYADEPRAGTMVVRNHAAEARSCRVRYEAFDFMNRVVAQGAVALAVPPRTTQRSSLDLAAGGRTGAFRLVTWVEDADRTERETVYAVIPRPPVAGADPGSYLGIHPNYVESQLKVLQRLGMKWGRVMSPSAFFRWNVVEPTEGKFLWFDRELRLGAAYGLTPMGTIGTNNFWPAWADAGGLPDLDKWQEFVRQLVAHYRPLVKHWEIWNEPGFAPDFYAQMLKRAVDAIKKEDPTAKVVGIGGMNLPTMQAFLQAVEVRYPAWDWKRQIDILSTHAYPGGTRPEDFRSAVIDRYGVPVWNTESGAWDHGFYQGPNSNFLSWGKNLWPYNDAKRYYDGMLGAPAEVAANFLRTIASGQTKYFYYDSRFFASPNFHRGHPSLLESDGTVRAKGIAYAIAGSFVDHARGLGNVSTDPACTVLLFDRPAGPVAALFSADHRPKQIALDPSQVRVLDLMGNPVAVSGSGIPFGRAPIYVQAPGKTSEALKQLLVSAAISSRKDTTAPELSISEGPRGPLAEGSFRVRWIAVDDASYPNLGEINPESRVASDVPNPHAILYAYRLKGHSADWSPWVANTHADFLRVPPGSYTFEVRARDEAGNESPVVARPVTVASN